MISKRNIWNLNGLLLALILIEIGVSCLCLTLFIWKPNFLSFIQWNLEKHGWIIGFSPIVSLVFLWNIKWKSNAILRWHRTSVNEYRAEKDHTIGFINEKTTFIKFIFWKLGFILLLISFLGPKSGGELQETTAEGIELVVALDISKSMLAEDAAPNRLYVAKKAILNIIQELKGDKVGIIGFAGNAYVQMPLSTDYNAAIAYLESMSTSSAGTQGTSISSALSLSIETLDQESNTSKVILLLTDGEDHEEEIDQVLLQAKEKNIKVSCIAIGSAAGAPIPDYASQNKYKQDANGNTIISKANTDLLEEIANNTNGFYTSISSSKPREISSILSHIQKEKKTETGNFVFVDLTPRYRISLVISIICLLIYTAIQEKHTS